MNKGGLHEDWQNPEALDGFGAVPFDWAAVESEVDGSTADLDPDERKRLAEAFIRVIQWQLRGLEKPSPGGTKAKARTIGIRAIALAYMLNPALLGGKRYAAQIARELGISRKTLHTTMASAKKHLWGTAGPVSRTSGG